MFKMRAPTVPRLERKPLLSQRSRFTRQLCWRRQTGKLVMFVFEIMGKLTVENVWKMRHGSRALTTCQRWCKSYFVADGRNDKRVSFTVGVVCVKTPNCEAVAMAPPPNTSPFPPTSHKLFPSPGMLPKFTPSIQILSTSITLSIEGPGAFRECMCASVCESVNMNTKSALRFACAM